MRIGIDGTCWANKRGYGRFVRGLLPALVDAPGGHEVVLFVDSHTQERGGLPEGVTSVVVPTRHAPTEAASHTGRRSLADLTALTSAVARRRLEVMLFPTVYTFFPVFTRARVVVGIHDAIPLDYPELVFPGRWRRWLWRLKVGLARRQADFLLTVSEHARRGLLRHYGLAPERIWVVDEAADPAFRPLAAQEIDPAVLARHGVAGGEPFIVYMGGINPHKNLDALLSSLAALRSGGFRELRLLLVGEVERDPFTPAIAAVRARIEALGLGEAVHFTGFVPDGEAAQLLNRALLLVLPSLAEGFGLPAVEAAACGTPVVATRESPLPELLAGGGLFVDPRDPAALTAALAELLGGEEQRRRMGEVALERARRLSWRRSAEQLLAHLEALDEGPKPRSARRPPPGPGA